jgi:hypothetical protein
MSTDSTPLVSTEPSTLPANGVLVHVGMHKTGTTAIQSVLADLRDQLVDEGISYPGEHESHHLAARALTQGTLGWQISPLAPPDPAVWDAFAAEVRDTRTRVVLSSEFFSSANAEQIGQLVQDLGPDRVHILIGVRNLGPVAISSWQQTLKQGRTSTLDRWLQANFARADPSEPPKWFWATFDPSAAIARWSAAAGPERVSVVVVRDGDRALLPNTFERLLGLPTGRLASQQVPRSNRGLTAAEAEAIRQINAQLRGKLEWGEYDMLVRNGAIRRMVETRSPAPDEPRPQLPDWVLDQVQAEGRRLADQITTSGVRVIGDLADLSAPAPADTATGSDAPPTVPLDAMVQAIVGAVAGATYGSSDFDNGRAPKLARVSHTTASRLALIVAQRAATRARRAIRRDASSG